MKVAIIGAGAMGGVWAARLANAGSEVSVVDVSEGVVAAINADGLTVDGKDGAASARVRATTDPREVGPVEAAFFFVKAHHTASAAELARPIVESSTTVVSLQNGWGNADVLAETYDPEQMVVGVTYNSATVSAPGRVAHTGAGPTFVGPFADGAGTDRADAIGGLMSGAGFETEATPKVKTEVWKKLILNAATLPTAALTLLRAGELGEPGPMLDLVDAVTEEAVRVARAQGYEIEIEERIERIHKTLQGAGTGKASMLQDVEGRRKTEIEVVNGAVVRAAEGNGVDVPLNKAMVALIGGLERGWRR